MKYIDTVLKVAGNLAGYAGKGVSKSWNWLRYEVNQSWNQSFASFHGARNAYNEIQGRVRRGEITEEEGRILLLNDPRYQEGTRRTKQSIGTLFEGGKGKEIFGLRRGRRP